MDVGVLSLVIFIGIILRLVGVIVCNEKAEKLNRSTVNWGIFGFFMPILAMIIISFLPANVDFIERKEKDYGDFHEISEIETITIQPTISKESQYGNLQEVTKKEDATMQSIRFNEDKYSILRKAKALLDDGVLTQDEFNNEKQKILNMPT